VLLKSYSLQSAHTARIAILVNKLLPLALLFN